MIIITDRFIKIFSPDIYLSGNLIEYISYLWVIINQSSIWFVTSLSIFLFPKVTNFSRHIFLWSKSRINRAVPFLMEFLLISWLLAFLQSIEISNDHRMSNRNTTWMLNIHKNKFFAQSGSHFPLCTILDYMLLVNHFPLETQQALQLNVTGFRDSNTEAHVKAMKVLISFIILFVLHFIGIAIELLCFPVSENKLLFIFSMIITFLYPWGHPCGYLNSRKQQAKASLFEGSTAFKVLDERGTSQDCIDRPGETWMLYENKLVRKGLKMFPLHNIFALVLTMLLNNTKIFHNYFDDTSGNITL